MAKAGEEGLQVADDAGGMDSHPLRIRLKFPKAPSEEQDCPGGGAGSETATAKDSSRECRLCGKIFKSSKAVDGHMRVHVEEKRREFLQRGDVISSTLSDGGKQSLECRVCGKTFPSRKSLNGHMRMHPDWTRRGVHPLAEDLFSGWSFTGKHRRNIDDGVKDSLRFKAMNDKGYLKLSLSISNNDVSVAGGSDETERHAGVDIKIEMPQDEKPPLDGPGIKAEEARSKNPLNCLRAIKRKARETNGAKRDVGNIPDPTPAKKYPCSRCHKSFAKYQSLGGHRSSCNKSKQSTSPAGQAAMPSSKSPLLDLSLSHPSSCPSNSGETESEPHSRTMGFHLNLSVTLSPEECDHRENLIKFL